MGNFQSNSLNKNGARNKKTQTYERKIEKYKQEIPKLRDEYYMHFKNILNNDLKLLEKEKYTENSKRKIRSEYQKLFNILATQEEIANRTVKFNREDKKRDSKSKLNVIEKKIALFEHQIIMVNTKEFGDNLREDIMKCQQSLNQNINKTKQHEKLLKRIDVLLNNLGRIVGKNSRFFEDKGPARELRPSTVNKEFVPLENHGAVRKLKKTQKLNQEYPKSNQITTERPKWYNGIKELDPKKNQNLIQGRKLPNSNQIKLDIPAPNPDHKDLQNDVQLNKPSKSFNVTIELDPLEEINSENYPNLLKEKRTTVKKRRMVQIPDKKEITLDPKKNQKLIQGRKLPNSNQIKLDISAPNPDLKDFQNDVQHKKPSKSFIATKELDPLEKIDSENYPNLLQEKRSTVKKIQEQQEKLVQRRIVQIPAKKEITLDPEVQLRPKNLKPRSATLIHSVDKSDPLVLVEKKLAELEIELQNFDGDQRGSEYLLLDQNLLKVVQDIEYADSSDNNRKELCGAKAKYLRNFFLKKIEEFDYEEKVSLRFGKIMKELTDMDVDLIGYMDDAKRIHVKNILTDFITKIDDVDFENHPNLLQEKRSLVRKIQEQHKKLYQMKILPVPDNKIEHVRESRPKIPNKPLEMTKSIKETDPLKYVEKNLTELQIQLDNFHGERNCIEYLHLDENLLKVVQDIKQTDSSDNNRKSLCMEKARDLHQSLLKKVEKKDADYEKKVSSRFGKIMKELIDMDVDLNGYMDNAKRIHVKNILTDFIREIDDVDSERHPNLLEEKSSLIRKILKRHKKLDQKKMLPVPDNKIESVKESKPKISNKPLEMTKSIKESDLLMYIEKKLTELQRQLDNFDGDRKSLEFLNLDQNFLNVVQDIKKAEFSDNNRKRLYAARARDMRQQLFKKIEEVDADYEKKVILRFEKIIKELTAMDVDLIGSLDEAKRTYVENILTDFIREIDDVDAQEHPNLLEKKRFLVTKILQQQKKLDQIKTLPVPDNKMENIKESRPKIPNKPLEMTKSIKEPDPLMYIQKKLTELQIQLDNFDGDRKSLDFLNLDQNFLNVVQDIKKAESSDNNRKRLYAARARDMRQQLFKKIEEVDANYEKKVILRFEKIIKELTAMDVDLIGCLDEAKRTYVENILTDFIREIDDVDTQEHPNLLEKKRFLVTKILQQQKKLDQIKTLPVPDNKMENVKESRPKIPNKPLEMTKSIKEPDPLMYIQKKLTELQIQLDNFDGDRKSLDFLNLDQNFLKVVQDIKKAETSDNNRKRLYAARARDMRQQLFKKIEEVDADYEKKVILRFEKIIKELTAMDVDLIGSLDEAKRTYVENILTDFIREIDDVDTQEHPNLLEKKRFLVTKILQQQKKLDQIKTLPVPDNKMENIKESRPKIPNKPLEMTKSIKEPDPLMYIQKKLTELQIQLDNFDGDRKSLDFLNLDQNFLKVVQDIKKAETSDNNRKRLYAARARDMRQQLFKKIEDVDADYEKKVILRFEKIIKELTAMDVDLIGSLDEAKRTYVENILTDFIREIDDVDTQEHPNLLEKKRFLVTKILQQQKKLDQIKTLPVPDNKMENIKESRPKIPNKPLEMTKSIKEPDPLMYIQKKLTELQIQLDNFDGDRKSLDFLNLDQNFLKVVQDIKKAETSDNNRKRLYAARARDMRQQLFKKIEEVDADYEKKVILRFQKIIKELTAMDVDLIGSLDEAKRTYVENILTDFIREIDDVDSEKHPNLLQEKRSLIRKIQEQQKKLDQKKMVPVPDNKIENFKESKPKITNKPLEITKSIKETDPLMYINPKLTELQIKLDNFDGDRKSMEFLDLDQNLLKVVQDIKQADFSDINRKRLCMVKAKGLRLSFFKKIKDIDGDYKKKVTLRFGKIMKELTEMDVDLIGYLDDAKRVHVENILIDCIREIDDVDSEHHPNFLQEKRPLLRKIQEQYKKLDQMKMLQIPGKERTLETNSMEKILKQIDLIDIQFDENLDNEKKNYLESQLAEVKVLVNGVIVTSSPNEKELLFKRFQDIENKLKQSKMKAGYINNDLNIKQQNRTTINQIKKITKEKEADPLKEINEDLVKIETNVLTKTNLWTLMNKLKSIESKLLAYNPATNDYHKRKSLLSKVDQLKKIFKSNEKINEIESEVETFKDDTGDASYFKLTSNIEELSKEINNWTDEKQKNNHLQRVNQLDSNLRKKAIENISKGKSEEISKIFELVNSELYNLQKEIHDFNGEIDFHHHLVQVLGNITERLDKIDTREEKQYLPEKRRYLSRVKELEIQLSSKYHH